MKLLYKHIIENQDLGLKLANPIRQFFGIDENENIRRIYWNDGVMPPRSLNVINTPEIIDPDLLNFSPPSNVGQINYYSEINGNLDCASYFFVFRLVSSDGAVTEYSFPTLPISIAADKIEGSNTYYKYQTYQGANFDIKSTSGIKVKVTNIDTRYKYIQVVAFKSIAYNTYVGGTLIANEEIGTNTTMFFNYSGSESLGSVSIADINISSMFIEQTDLMEIVKNKNVLANFKEKEELPEGDIITYSQVNGVVLTKEYYQIPVDSKVDMNLYNVETSTTINDKPLHGIAINHAYLYKDFWYKNTSTGAFILGDGLTAKTSIYVPYIRIVKYTTSLGEKIYDNIPLNNEFMNYKGKKISSLLKGYMGTETYRLGIVFFSKGKPYGVRYLGDVTMPVRTGWWSMLKINSYDPGVIADHHVMAKILSIIVNNLDLTEFVETDDTGLATSCLIDGFSIVRCERDEQVISEGLLLPIIEKTDRNMVCWPTSDANINTPTRIENLYAYYSPEYLFRVPGKEIHENDTLRLHTYLNAWFSENEYGGKNTVDSTNLAQKYYLDTTRPSTTLPQDGNENSIEAVYDLPFNKDGFDLAVPELGVIIRNEAEIEGSGRDSYGCDTKIIITRNIEAGDENSWASWLHSTISIVDQVKKKSSLYGGSGEAALANNSYISTGHYQEITMDILNSISTGTLTTKKFVFNNIQVFGGDTFITIFDLERMIKHRKNDHYDFSHAMIFPIQTIVNTELRKGVHVSKDRAYHASQNPTGIGVEGTHNVIEDFNYNDAYSTAKADKIFLPLEYNYEKRTKFPYSFQWSLTKTPGEKIDNYRRFPVNNRRSIDQSFGPITFIAAGIDKLIYLQEKGIGYLSIDERVMINNTESQPVQLGLGGTFERFDTTEKFYGCQHFFSACKVPNGIAFFDFNNRAFIFLDNSMELIEESLIKGLEPYFNALPADLRLYDNPYSSYGFFTYYEKVRKEIIMVIKNTDDSNIAITFNNKIMMFTGTLDLIPSVVTNALGYMFATQREKPSIFINNFGKFREYFEVAYEGSIRFVINNQPDDNKKFDNFRIIGNDKSFNRIIYKPKNSDADIEEIVANSDNLILSEYLEYLNFEWAGSFPQLGNGERLEGHYLEFELIVDSNNQNDVRLLKLITSNRKTY